MILSPSPKPARVPRIARDERGGIFSVLVILLVLIVAVGGAGYWFFIREDAKAKPKIDVTKVVAGGAIDGTWELTPNAAGSFAQYRITEKFAQGLVENEATGQTADVTGSLKISGTTISGIDVTANLAVLKSDKDFRDNALKDRGLETNKFPTATFVATEPISLPSAPTKGVTLDVPITGDLTMHGVTKSVSITMKGRWDGAKIQVIGEVPINLGDYGITAPTSPVVAEVDDQGTIELNLFFTKAS